MRLAFYAPLKPPDAPTPSGDRLIARMILAALARHGHQAEVVARLRTFDRDGDPHRQARLAAIGSALAGRLAARLASRPPGARPELWLTYHLYHKAPDWLGPPVARALAIPYAVVEASLGPRQADGRWRHGHQAVCRALADARLVVSLNPRDEAALPPFLAAGARHHLARPFIDGAPFRAARAAREACRAGFLAAHRLDPSVPILIAVAMMRADAKRESYRVLAAALARLSGSPWQLIVVGDGAARGEVESMFAPIAGRVRWLGALAADALAAALAQADIMVWPAVNEAIGMALIEAEAAGLPVIAARREGVAGVVADGLTGLLVGEHDAAAFAAAVSALLADPARRTAMGAAAARHAETHLDIETAGRKLCGALADLVPHPAPAP
jgi:glycosyltransferase involved in cell wall biosynthesis